MNNVFPNLFLPGAAKSGTSSLHDYLNQHPDIYMSEVKEPLFFINDEKYSEGLDNYLELFKNAEDKKIRGESSTAYMIFPNVVERIKESIKSDIKFLFILRNPIDRAYSHYWWLKGLGVEKKEFKNAFLEDINVDLNYKNNYTGLYKSYYEFGCYGKHLNKFYNNFKKEDILVVTTEELKSNSQETLNKCFNFLGVDILDINEIKSNRTVILKYARLHYHLKKILYSRKLSLIKKAIPNFLKSRINSAIDDITAISRAKKAYPKLSSETRAWLLEYYKNDVDLLKDITKLDFVEWKDFS